MHDHVCMCACVHGCVGVSVSGAVNLAWEGQFYHENWVNYACNCVHHHKCFIVGSYDCIKLEIFVVGMISGNYFFEYNSVKTSTNFYFHIIFSTHLFSHKT